MKLIDKNALVAEIEKLDALCHLSKNLSGEFFIEGLFRFLDTSEVKEVDLEKEYKDFVEKDPVYNKLVNGIVGKAIAKHFYELGLKARKGERGVKYIDADKLISEIKLIQQSLEHRNVQLNQTKKIRTECMKELCECIISSIISLSVDAESNNAQKGE